MFSPLRPAKIFSPPIFHQILKVFHRPKFAQKKVVFSPRGSAGGGHAKENHGPHALDSHCSAGFLGCLIKVAELNYPHPTPASVAATPPCSATPFQRQLDVRHSWPSKGDRCDRAFLGGCSALLQLHLKNP